MNRTPPERIRIRANHKLDDGRQSLRASVVFQDLQVGQTKVLKQPRWLWGHKLYIAALRLEDGELLITRLLPVSPKQPHQLHGDELS